MQYRLWRVVTAIVRRLPPRVAYTLAGLIGTLGFHCWPRGRRSTVRNFRRVLPAARDAEVRRIARRSLANYCRYLVDFVRFPSLSPQALIEAAGGQESFASLDAALIKGKGAIIVCMHFGNWDMGAGAASARGYPVTVVVETFDDQRLDDMVVGARRRLGMQLVKMEKAGPSLIRALKQNGVLALLIDRPTPGDGIKVQLFGKEVEVPAGPARLALRTGATVVAAAFPRIQPNRPEVKTLTDFSIEFVPTDNEEDDIRALTQAIVQAHERFIRAYPDQWYMFREMWPEAPQQAAR